MNTSTRCVNLSRSEIEYLKTAGFLGPVLLKCVQNARWRSDIAATIELSAMIAEEFREAFTEQLAKVGFDEAYELTAEGRLLEDLIDRFHKP
ncbi:hypothetical protein [Nitrosomonas sp.]|uniref:hypothetical protein n=1 Tax=Nitrosomonas sp. TaxID=42353 RepID=UPI0026014AAF|nr:hypothetical protein [Nitrosomonas sp.]